MKKIIYIVISCLLISILVPKNGQNVNAATSSVIVKSNIEIPGVFKDKNGLSYYGKPTSKDLGTFDISKGGIPEGAKIISVKLLDSSNNVVKTITDKTGTVYNLGSVTNKGSEPVTAEAESTVGEFQWWRASGNTAWWAFDFEGVRHWRNYGITSSYPVANGTYYNALGTGNPSGNGDFSSTGRAPSGYSAPTSNHLLPFTTETSGNANVGWDERQISITSKTFSNNSLGIRIISSSLYEIEGVVNYEPSNSPGYIPSNLILSKRILESPSEIVSKGRVTIWYSARMGDYGITSNSGVAGILYSTYYNKWKVELKSKVYKYDTYSLQVEYENDNELLEIEGASKACVAENVTLKANYIVKGIGTFDFTSRTTWSSSDTTIATVNQGKVTTIKAGEVTITGKYFETSTNTNYVVTHKLTVAQCGDVVLTVDGEFNACPQVGHTLQFKSTIQKKDGYTWNFLTTTPHAKLVYKSSNTSVASVSDTGLVRLVGVGSASFTITYTEGDGSPPVVVTKSVTVKAQGGCDTTPPTPSTNSCIFSISPSGVGATLSASYLNATPFGSISSQSGEFNVVSGIPSSEYLKTDTTSAEYLYEQLFQQQRGKIIYTIQAKKTFILEWEETLPLEEDAPEGAEPQKEKKSETEEKTVTLQIERDYTYWTVETFNVWGASNAKITNYALPNEQSIMYATNSVTASAVKTTGASNHVFPGACPEIVLPQETLNGGASKPTAPDITSQARSEAEAKVEKPNVKNDRVTFNGSTLMSDNLTSGGNAPTPSNVPYPPQTTMNNTNLLIDGLKTNYYNSPSTGLMTYQGVYSLNGVPSERSFPYNVNVVTVHTPVIIKAAATDDKQHDQRINPPLRSTPINSDTERHAFILDRPFTVMLPTVGQHRNIQGYGNRDYSKYIKQKQVKFPFDVYTETKAAYYPANTWINVPVNAQEVTFFLPVWVTEGQYTVEFSAYAINALSGGDFGGAEKEANITIPNMQVNVSPANFNSAAHTAFDSIQVDVVGRMYDFKVTNIDDYNWKNVFRNANMTLTNNSYYVGLTNIDKNVRGNQDPYVLPVTHASNPNGIKNLAVKTGYNFNFDLKTSGNMADVNDAIRIKPSFYFVSKDGRTRFEIDVYYHSNDKKFIKIGSQDDTVYRSVSLNSTSRTISNTELLNNATFYYDHSALYNLSTIQSDYSKGAYTRQYARKDSKEAVETGPYAWQILNWKLRTFIGPATNQVPTSTMIPKDEVTTKVQNWYGEYSLPAKVFAVAKNTKIHEVAQLGSFNENNSIFLKNGYIVVNFDIETINNGNVNAPYLSYYKAKYMSQWSDMESYRKQFVDGYGRTFQTAEGDIIYYHADQSSLDDFTSSVTH
jgi:hypothetical protein